MLSFLFSINGLLVGWLEIESNAIYDKTNNKNVHLNFTSNNDYIYFVININTWFIIYHGFGMDIDALFVINCFLNAYNVNALLIINRFLVVYNISILLVLNHCCVVDINL